MLQAISRKSQCPESQRQQWFDGVRDDENHIFVKLSRKICGDQGVFLKLVEYVGANRDVFKPV